MQDSIQTTIALLCVALAAAWIVRSLIRTVRSPDSSTSCGSGSCQTCEHSASTAPRDANANAGFVTLDAVVHSADCLDDSRQGDDAKVR